MLLGHVQDVCGGGGNEHVFHILGDILLYGEG